MHTKWTKAVAMFLIPALLLLAFPSACNAGDFSDNSSQGAAITLGLFSTILAVLFIVSFKTDVDNVFSKNQKQEPPNLDDSLADSVSLVLEPPRISPTQHNLEQRQQLTHWRFGTAYFMVVLLVMGCSIAMIELLGGLKSQHNLVLRL